jgi:hypothetical protein
MNNEMISDLDELMPENEIVSFTAADGKKYQISLFIPFAVGQMLIENADKVLDMFGNGRGKPKLNIDTLKLALRILNGIMESQHPHMNEDWIERNISLPRLAVILYKAAMPIYRFLSQMGELAEMARPKKEADVLQ